MATKTSKTTKFTSNDALVERKRKHLPKAQDELIERQEGFNRLPDEIKAARIAMMRQMQAAGYKF